MSVAVVMRIFDHDVDPLRRLIGEDFANNTERVEHWVLTLLDLTGGSSKHIQISSGN